MSGLQGYPDYARLPLASGVLIAGGAQVFSGNTLIVEQYVGNYPYINHFWGGGGGLRHYAVSWQWFSDSTFTHQVAVRTSYRDDLSYGYVQIPVLSPWLVSYVEADSGASPGTTTYAYYGTSGKTSAAAMAGPTAQYSENQVSVSANSTDFFETTFIVPGPVSWSWLFQVTQGEFILQRWDFGSQSWQTFYNTILNANGVSDHETIGMPDAPARVGLWNHSSSTGTMGAWGMPVNM